MRSNRFATATIPFFAALKVHHRIQPREDEIPGPDVASEEDNLSAVILCQHFPTSY